MTDRAAIAQDRWSSADFQARLAARKRSDAVFRSAGLGAIMIALGMLALLLYTVISAGLPAFVQTQIDVEVFIDPDVVGPDASVAEIRRGNYMAMVRPALAAQLTDADGRAALRDVNRMISRVAAEETLSQLILDDRNVIGSTVQLRLPAASPIDQFVKHGDSNGVSERQQGWIAELDQAGRIHSGVNWQFLTGGASREAELAGLGAAFMGSVFTIIICALLAVPFGVAAAIYLEEFAPKNRWTDLIEVNISNLAAVPSIVFGLLGLAVFLNVFGLPRATPLAGGAVLALMVLPVIIIAARAALRAVPPSIREAALGVGASKLQTVTHHVLPLAMPGILTGTIISLAQALGETAPLLMMGMVGFIVDVPMGFTDAATVLPVQIYQWAGFPEGGFREKTSAAIMVLLLFLVLMNGLAVWMRRKFETRW